VEDRQVLLVQRDQQAHKALQGPRAPPDRKDLLDRWVLPDLRARPDCKVLRDRKGCEASRDQQDRPVLKVIVAKLGRLDHPARSRPTRMRVFAASTQMAKASRARPTKPLFPRFARILANRQPCKAGPCVARERPGSLGSACESSNERSTRRNIFVRGRAFLWAKMRHRAPRFRASLG
jgi:hypothetical protein